MIENLQEKLRQGKHKQSKGAKIYAIIRWELECEKFPKTFCKIFGRQNIQKRNNTWHSSNTEGIFNPYMHKMVPGDSSTILLATIFAQKNARSWGSMYPSILMLGNIWYYHFTWSGPNSQEIGNLFQFNSGPQGPTIKTKFTISCEFRPL